MYYILILRFLLSISKFKMYYNDYSLHIYDICTFLFFFIINVAIIIYFIINKIFYLIFFVNSTLSHGKVKQNIIWTTNT